MENETLIRLGIFLGLFALFATLEALLPRRKRMQPRTRRWSTNLTIVLIDSAFLRLIALAVPLLAVGAAADAAANGWGLLNVLALPAWSELVIAVLMLDFAIWAQHLISHKVPLFWRFHRMHHADRDFDVSTALRFHPFEIGASMLLKIALVYLLGPSVLAVVVFEVLLNGTAMFNHANMRLPVGLDAFVRRLLVTPDMHRVHHSVISEETNSNYGFALAVWDRAFGTYRKSPVRGHDAMTLGLPAFRAPGDGRLFSLLLNPFR